MDEKTGYAFFTAELIVRKSKSDSTSFAAPPATPVEILIPLSKCTAPDYLLQPLTESL